MRIRLLPILLLLCSAAALGAADLASSPVPAAAVRKPIVDRAVAYAQREVSPPLPGPLRNPFDLLPGEVNETASVKVLSDSDVLDQIASRIVPSGTASFKGEMVLLIKGRKFRKGDHLVVTLDNRDYDIEITEIQRTTYTLKYNRTELIRPIKTK